MRGSLTSMQVHAHHSGVVLRSSFGVGVKGKPNVGVLETYPYALPAWIGQEQYELVVCRRHGFPKNIKDRQLRK